MRYFKLILALFFASLVYGQPGQVQVNADCNIAFNLTASGATTGANGFNNVPVGCNSWQIQYTNNGFSAITLAIQSAPNTSATANTGVCTPGSWGTLGGTATFGVNPNTNTTAASSLIQSYATNFAPCVRVALTSATGAGNVAGILLGFRASGSAGTSSGGGIASNINLQNVAGVATASDANGGLVLGGLSQAQTDGISNTQTVPQFDNAGTPAAGVAKIYPFDYNGGTWDRHFACVSSTEVALSGTGYTQIIALSGSTIIRLCKVFVTSSSSGNPSVNTFTLAYGTGSNCAAGTAELQNAAGITGLDEDYSGALRTASGNAFCVKEAVANSDKVTVTYVQY
jgi:hypothetical protein